MVIIKSTGLGMGVLAACAPAGPANASTCKGAFMSVLRSTEDGTDRAEHSLSVAGPFSHQNKPQRQDAGQRELEKLGGV